MKISSEYRSIARNNLKNNWGTAVIVCIIVLAISAVLGAIPLIGPIVLILLSGQLAVGQIYYFINLNKKENAQINDLFKDFTKDLFNNFKVFILQLLYLALWLMLFIIPGIIKSYSYSMTMFLKAKQPNLNANDAITLSRKIMNGKKWKLFCLHFSFIGWLILSTMSFGIGFIFLMPYVQASVTSFYEDAYAEYLQEPIVIENSEI